MIYCISQKYRPIEVSRAWEPGSYPIPGKTEAMKEYDCGAQKNTYYRERKLWRG